MKNVRIALVILAVLAASGCGRNSALFSPPTEPPDIPAAIALMDASASAIKIRWNDASDNEASFVVQRSADASFTTVVEIVLPAGSVTWTDAEGLAPDTDYYYHVCARNAIGDSPFTDTLIARTEAVTVIEQGLRVADHRIVGMIPSGQIPIADIQNAKAGLHIAYGHTSHGSQLTTGMQGLVAFANGSGCGGAYAGSQDLFSFDWNGEGGALHLREGNEFMNADAGYYSTVLTMEQYFAAKDYWILHREDPTPPPHPDSNWEYETRYFLGPPSDRREGTESINVIIWSWCGQVGGKNETTIYSEYLTPMVELQQDYPGITFIYMTGHLDGGGATGAAHTMNDYIRAHCAEAGTNRWLFDFEDIETYDPDGISYLDFFVSDGCVYDFNGNGWCDRGENTEVLPANGDRNWALDWQAAHVPGTDWFDCGAAHSVSVNANMKAYAAWWLWARLSGWDIAP